MHPSLLLLLSLVLVTGCGFIGTSGAIQGSGVVASETREVEDFSRIRLVLPAQLSVTVGAEAPRLQIEADDNLLEHIRTEVSNGTLSVSSDERISPESPIVINIQVPTLADLQITGAGRATLEGIDGESLRLSVTGAGDITASGATADLEIAITGAGRLNLVQLDVQRASVRITGSGNVDLTCHESLDARISGSGNVTYRGEAEATTRITGSGRVRRAD